MELSVRMICMSHLSDLHFGVDKVRIEFIKYLLLRYPNTDTLVNPELEFEIFSFNNPITTKGEN